jgi:hypothetical protein
MFQANLALATQKWLVADRELAAVGVRVVHSLLR